VRVSPKDSNTPLLFNTGKNLPPNDSTLVKN